LPQLPLTHKMPALTWLSACGECIIFNVTRTGDKPYIAFNVEDVFAKILEPFYNYLEEIKERGGDTSHLGLIKISKFFKEAKVLADLTKLDSYDEDLLVEILDQFHLILELDREKALIRIQPPNYQTQNFLQSKSSAGSPLAIYQIPIFLRLYVPDT